jgi:D-sedoheptulose 7-phosphate isomerase
VRVAERIGIETWALTGPAPNALAGTCTEAVPFSSPHAATVQELHTVAVHLICAAVDREVALRSGTETLEEALR